MIRVITGFSGPGGSTVAFCNLVNLFNENDLEACFYGPFPWEGINCNFSSIDKLQIAEDDVVIYHFLQTKNKPNCKKLILSCHETNLFKIKDIPELAYDNIHFVSNSQKQWQGLDGVIIPNVITPYVKESVKTENKVAGIIGSVDINKNVHEAIKRALADEDVSEVLLYGAITDGNYFNDFVGPLLGDKVKYCGISTDMQEVYDNIDVVYSSSKSECLSMIQGECLQMGIEYRGLDTNTRSVEDYEFDNSIILEKWKTLLFT